MTTAAANASSFIMGIIETGTRRLIGLDRPTKRLLVLAADAILCVFAVWVAFSLRLGVWLFFAPPVVNFTLAAVLVFPPTFYLSGTYRHIFRFAGAGTIAQLGVACAITALPLMMVFSFSLTAGVPRTVPVLHAMIFFGLLSVSRITARYVFFDLRQESSLGPVKRVMIYGATTAGRQLSASLRGDPAFELYGIIDDDPRLDRQRLDRTVIHHSERLSELINRHGIETIFIALTNSTRAERNEVIHRLRGLKVSVLTLPTAREIASGAVTISDLREVRIEELLGRDAVTPRPDLLTRTIAGKTVLVTGAGGSIGSELCRRIVTLGPRQLVLVEMSEPALFAIDRELAGFRMSQEVRVSAELVNIVDRAAVGRLFSRWKPDTVFHAAAYKHVPLIEANVLSGLRNNILGTRTVATAAAASTTERFILVSTDKAVRPTSVMGASKRACELILQALAADGGRTCFSMVRFGNVLNSSGSVVPLFREQINRGGPVTVTHRDVTRFFMTIPEAAQLVIQAGALAKGGEVFLLDMGKPVRIEDLARTMIELAGRSVRSDEHPEGDIEIVEIGLRPGEKLYEELLIGEDSGPTEHAMIRYGRERSIATLELEPNLAALDRALEAGDEATALNVLRTLVPEYAPSVG